MELPDAPMIGVEDRLPGGLATAEDALLDSRRLDAALDETVVPPLIVLLDARLEAARTVGVESLSRILLEARGVSGSFWGERGRSCARAVEVEAVL